MNCDRCQELLSDFLDGALNDEDHLTLGAHLEECLSCYSVRHELDSIVSFCQEHRGEYDAPPNERALWLRIRNTIESQSSNTARTRTVASEANSGRAFGWLSGLLNRQWELSLPQMASAVAAIALAVSFATVWGVRSMQSSGAESTSAVNNSGSSNASLTAASYQGNLDDRMKQQQQMIDYWNRRVEQRRAMWNAQTRGAFDRNVQVIDQAVSAYREDLRRNPNDEVSEEMLNVALNEKMDLLREFSEL